MPWFPTPTVRLQPVSSDDGITVSLPGLDEIADCWPILGPMLARATKRVRGYEPIDLLQLVMLGRMNMILVRERGRIAAVAVTEVHQYPRCRVLECPFIAGTGMRRWGRHFLDVIEAQAEALGCEDIAGWDRKGWAHFGFEVVGVAVMRRRKDEP